MKWIIMGLVLAGLVAAFSASALTAALRIDQGGFQPVAEPETVAVTTIVVATRDVGALTVLSADDITVKTVPAQEVPTGAFTSPSQAIGRLLTVPVAAGQPFLQRSLAGDEAGRHLAATLPQGARAITIPLGAEAGLEGLLYPGCLVDVVASFRIPRPGGATSEIVSATVLQAVQVLAIGGRTVVSTDTTPLADRPTPRRRTVTLLVDSKQAESLQLAMTQGSITLAMRNPQDTGASNGTGVTLSDLSGALAKRLAAMAAAAEPEPAPAVAQAFRAARPEVKSPQPQHAEPEPWTIVVHHGTSVEEVTFPQPARTDPQEDGQ